MGSPTWIMDGDIEAIFWIFVAGYCGMVALGFRAAAGRGECQHDFVRFGAFRFRHLGVG